MSGRVSIHAPAWGATSDGPPEKVTAGFNPRARVGRDFQIDIGFQFGLVSIHAPAWGATITDKQINTATSFNPRARVGRDDL